jgi:hypothetical protein
MASALPESCAIHWQLRASHFHYWSPADRAPFWIGSLEAADCCADPRACTLDQGTKIGGFGVFANPLVVVRRPALSRSLSADTRWRPLMLSNSEGTKSNRRVLVSRSASRNGVFILLLLCARMRPRRGRYVSDLPNQERTMSGEDEKKTASDCDRGSRFTDGDQEH